MRAALQFPWLCVDHHANDEQTDTHAKKRQACLDSSCPMKVQMLRDKSPDYRAIKHPLKRNKNIKNQTTRKTGLELLSSPELIFFLDSGKAVRLTPWTKLPRIAQTPFQECLVPLHIPLHYTEENKRMSSMCFPFCINVEENM